MPPWQNVLQSFVSVFVMSLWYPGRGVSIWLVRAQGKKVRSSSLTWHVHICNACDIRDPECRCGLCVPAHFATNPSGKMLTGWWKGLSWGEWSGPSSNKNLICPNSCECQFFFIFGIVPFDVISVKGTHKEKKRKHLFAMHSLVPGTCCIWGSPCSILATWKNGMLQAEQFAVVVWKSDMTDVFLAVLMLQHAHEWSIEKVPHSNTCSPLTRLKKQNTTQSSSNIFAPPINASLFCSLFT